jgi:hypothetical protein
MSKATKPVLTYAQFANDLGAHQRLTLAVSVVWHKQYAKASAVTRTALRDEFMTHFTMGMLACNMKQAVRILTATISERTEAYMAASQKFKYHIARDGAKSETKPVKSLRIPREMRVAANDFLSLFDSAEDAIKVLRAVAK